MKKASERADDDRTVRHHLIESIDKGLKNALGEFANMEMEPETHSVRGPDDSMSVIAVIGFDGSYQGLVSLHCPEGLAVRITSGMLGVTPSGVDEDVRDAIGEVVNILGGEVKGVLSPGGMDIKLSTPSVFNGEKFYGSDTSHGFDKLFRSYVHDGERLLVGVKMVKIDTHQV